MTDSLKNLVFVHRKEATQRSSVSKPVQDVDSYCVNHLIGHNWIHMMGMGWDEQQWEHTWHMGNVRLEGPHPDTRMKVSFINIIATHVTCYESIYLEARPWIFQRVSVFAV